MYWWNESKLAQELRDGQVEEKERFNYYFAVTVAAVAYTEVVGYIGHQFNMPIAVRSAVYIAVAIIGTILCYRANRNGDNNDFISRMICLSWPIGVKLNVVFAAIVCAVSVSERIAGTEIVSPHLARIYDLLVSICYYWLLHKYVKLVAQPKEALGTPT